MNIKFKKAISLLVMFAMIISNFSGLGIKASAAVAYAEDLIISEYVEGGGYNKAIEIYNGTGKTVDLSEYALELRPYSSGKPGTITNVSLTGMLEHNDVMVYKNKDLKSLTITRNVVDNAAINFNGDDFILLLKKGQVIDVFGSDSGENVAADKTYVRKPYVMKGNTAAFKPKDNAEWVEYPKDTLNYLGSHLVSYGSTKVMAVSANIASGTAVSIGTTVSFESLTSGSSVQIATFDGTKYGQYENRNTFIVNNDVKLRVKAVADGLEDSDIQEFEYFVKTVEAPVVDIKTLKAGYIDEKDPVTGKQDFMDDRGESKIKVTVTVLDYAGYTFAQDATGGIGLKLPNTSDFNVGDELEITAILSSDYNFMYMSPRVDQVKKLGTKAVEPKLVTPDQVSTDTQGMLVKLVDTKIASGPDYTNEFKIDSATPTATIVKPANPEWITAGKTYQTIIGVVFYSYSKYSVAPAIEDHVIENELQVKPVKASAPAGKVSAPITLTTATPDAKIYYTVDGSNPVDADGKLVASVVEYKIPIVIDGTVTVRAIAIKEGFPSSYVFTAEYYTATSVGKKEIYEIQGASHRSPLVFSTVENVEGIVTAVANNGFYMQSFKDDNDDKTSNGIFVNKATTSALPVVGDHVSVTGTVYEFTNTSVKCSLSTTELKDTEVKVIQKGVELPKATILGEGGRIIPSQVVDNDSFSVFDPEEDAIDFYESIEGMYVEVDDALVTGSYSNKEFNILSNKGRLAADRLTIYGGIKLVEGCENPDNILVVNGLAGKNAVPNMGNEFSAPIKGILTYKDAKYVLMNNEVLPTILPADQTTKRTPLVRETTTLEAGEDKLTVASYNIENFSASTGKGRVGAIADTMINNLKTPDIIGLLEIQDDNGPNVNDGNVDATETLKLLTTTINTKTGGATDYDFVQINPVNNQDGGQPGANIRVGFIYNKKRVTLRPGTAGDATTGVTVVNKHLSVNPGRIFSEDPTAFEATRKSLAVEFDFNGQTVVTIANHFSSKSGSGPLFGSQQPKVDPVFDRRVKQGKAINSFVKEFLSQDPDAKIIAMGDLNAYEFEEAARQLAGTELTNLAYTLPLNERFSYLFQGSSQVLDQMLVTKSLADKAVYDMVHINAFFTEAEGAVSDHDPVVAQFDMSTGTRLINVIKNFGTLATNKTPVEVRGTIASKVRVDSKKYSNFYLNDSTGGMAVYVKVPVVLKEGDVVSLTGICSTYNDLMQMTVDKAENVKVIENGKTVVAKSINLSDINIEKSYLASKIEKAVLKEITTAGDAKYGNTLWKFEKDGTTFDVKLDSRFGEKYDAIADSYKVGDLYNINGFIEWNSVKSTYIIQVDSSTDVAKYEESKPVLPIQSVVATMDSKGLVKDSFEKNDMIFIKTDLKKVADSKGSAIMLYKLTKNNSIYRFGSTESELIRVGDQSHKYGFDTTGLETGEYTVSVYVWDSLELMNPIAEVAKTTITIK